MNELQLIECPRDAMQGITEWVPTALKVSYINHLLKCGFHTIDFGSFVSPKAIPQMRDTAEVLKGLELNSETKLLAIVANLRGAKDALSFSEIDYLGFPFSVSEEFQKRNTNSSISDSLKYVEEIQNICIAKNKQLVIYLSMGFGNPYGEEWNPELVINWSKRLYIDLGVKVLALSDTIGCAKETDVSLLFTLLNNELTNATIGAHFHTRPTNSLSLVKAAYDAGCRRFDSAIKGFGGCPMAKDDLTGNLPTEDLLHFFNMNKINNPIDRELFNNAYSYSSKIFKS
ncbi:MAG: hydroxymethylglutaryl-CoA lyase [Bacteroidetes bacterium]|nr:hydroxymethylglutaryl-CoA lyase [Bacteroidota bacterium]